MGVMFALDLNVAASISLSIDQCDRLAASASGTDEVAELRLRGAGLNGAREILAPERFYATRRDEGNEVGNILSRAKLIGRAPVGLQSTHHELPHASP
ncbi:hypothetical protein GCM10011488_22540 [Steroidobacter agaridevorans]|nr:hypothetical protein GCM10011488_22540 [Steroidobacter agaridevorans]